MRVDRLREAEGEVAELSAGLADVVDDLRVAGRRPVQGDDGGVLGEGTASPAAPPTCCAEVASAEATPCSPGATPEPAATNIAGKVRPPPNPHLAAAEEAARDAVPRADTAGRLVAVGTAFREWAIRHPEEFQLIYGDAVPGYQEPEGGAATAAERRACAVLTGIVADAWPHAEHSVSDGDYTWSDFPSDFGEAMRELFPDLPPAAVALAMRVWGRMHGLVSLEVYGHLRSQVNDPAKLYHAELLDLVRTLGLNR